MNKILIIEDEKEIRENLEILLDAEGYATVSADNGLDALKKLEKFTPDLILSDIMMPYFNGLELFQRIKEESRTKIIPFIFLTAKSDLSSIRHGMNLGADDYITKPFSTKDLLRAIKIRLEKNKIINEQIDEIRDSISMYVPHELRNPLVAIMGYSQIILEEKESIGKTEIIEMVDRISLAGKRLHNRIEKFIQLSDINPVTKVLSPGEKLTAKIDNDTVKEISLSHYIVKERKEKIEISIEPAEIKITERYLRIILIELLENAVKFSEYKSSIVVLGIRADNFYILEVKDNGIGMDDSQISRIGAFRQFERNVYQQEGNGLGLIAVKRILDSIDGVFEIESEKFKHTNVVIKIPML